LRERTFLHSFTSDGKEVSLPRQHFGSMNPHLKMQVLISRRRFASGSELRFDTDVTIGKIVTGRCDRENYVLLCLIQPKGSRIFTRGVHNQGRSGERIEETVHFRTMMFHIRAYGCEDSVKSA
jgi:hypothetical protein